MTFCVLPANLHISPLPPARPDLPASPSCSLAPSPLYLLPPPPPPATPLVLANPRYPGVYIFVATGTIGVGPAPTGAPAEVDVPVGPAAKGAAGTVVAAGLSVWGTELVVVVTG